MDTRSEEYRHRCEVRHLIAERIRRGPDGKVWLQGYLVKLHQPRRQNLERDIRQQWSAGNKGQRGMWSVVS
jgi:hypothetical protein